MLTGSSWDELPFLGTFQSGGHEELSKVKIRNLPISAHNYHTSTILMSKYMFWGVPKVMGCVLNRLLNIKRVKMQDFTSFTPQFYQKFIICPKE